MVKHFNVVPGISFLSVGRPDSNTYIIDEEHLIDAGLGLTPKLTLQGLEKFYLKADEVNKIIVTHHHLEHTGGLSLFPNAEVMMHKSAFDKHQKKDAVNTHKVMYPIDFPKIGRFVPLAHKDTIRLGQRKLQIFQSPDNEEGHICIYDADSKVLFSGQTPKDLIDVLNLDVEWVCPAFGEPYKMK